MAERDIDITGEFPKAVDRGEHPGRRRRDHHGVP
jgi:hypothetical protein